MALKRVWDPSPNWSSRGGSGVRLVVVHTADGRTWPYDVLLSTMPLDDLVACAEQAPDAVRAAAGSLE